MATIISPLISVAKIAYYFSLLVIRSLSRKQENRATSKASDPPIYEKFTEVLFGPLAMIPVDSLLRAKQE